MEKSTAEKALSLNLIKPLYGSIAEIGAGQEVARWFFKVGGAAGTIAKAMSAYDMAFSDDIYGKEKSGRYVVESRVRRMLDHEYSLLESRLSEKDNREKYFFAFANTVAAKSFKYNGDCHGWVGLKFQHTPTQTPSQVILHVRMLDRTNLHQQEALGVLGVNLIYACYHHFKDPEQFLKSLLDGELSHHIEINMIKVEGPVFDGLDPISLNLLLIRQGLTPVVLLPSRCEPCHLGEEIYNMQVIIHRKQPNGKPHPSGDILSLARDHYCGQKTEGLCDPYLVTELYFDPKSMELDGVIDEISRLVKDQKNVMVSRYDRTFKLTEYIAHFTNNHINVVFPATKIIEILENEKLASLDRLARIFNERTRMYIYSVDSSMVPDHLKKDKTLVRFNLSNYEPSQLNCHLYRHLLESGYVQEIGE